MVADLENSPQIDKPRTKRTSSLTLDQALEILQQAALNYEKAGGDIKVSTLHHAHKPSVILVLAGIELLDGRLVPVKEQQGA